MVTFVSSESSAPDELLLDELLVSTQLSTCLVWRLAASYSKQVLMPPGLVCSGKCLSFPLLHSTLRGLSKTSPQKTRTHMIPRLLAKKKDAMPF